MTHANTTSHRHAPAGENWNKANGLLIVEHALTLEATAQEKQYQRAGFDNETMHPQATWPWELIQEIQEKMRKTT